LFVLQLQSRDCLDVPRLSAEANSVGAAHQISR
jgi:hypothetical protein